jgi:hypothetical protein
VCELLWLVVFTRRKTTVVRIHRSVSVERSTAQRISGKISFVFWKRTRAHQALLSFRVLRPYLGLQKIPLCCGRWCYPSAGGLPVNEKSSLLERFTRASFGMEESHIFSARSSLSWFHRNQGSIAEASVGTAENEFPKVSRKLVVPQTGVALSSKAGR